MSISAHTILITGGSEGIGLALAKRLSQQHQVLICGRDPAKLASASQGNPNLIPYRCDLRDPEACLHLAAQIKQAHPNLNWLINNAGAKSLLKLAQPDANWQQALADDLSLNFQAAVILSQALLPLLQQQAQARIINVTSGLVHLPRAEQPFYCAAKAALHSYSQSLRWACRDSRLRVHEALLPLVRTGFHPQGLPQHQSAWSAEQVASALLKAVEAEQEEIYLGKAKLTPWLANLWPQLVLRLVNH